MRLKYTFEMMELDDQIIAVPVGDNANDFRGVIKLNQTAACIFELLKEEKTVEEIVESLSNEYDAPQEILVKDVQRYVNDFQEKGLLA